MFALVLFSFLFGLSMFFIRVNSARGGKTDLKFFKTYSEGKASDTVVKWGQHFTNLFEVPVIFYACCITFLALNLYSSTALVLAWMFFALRLLHAFIHVTYNKVIHRALAFFAGVFCLMGMWVCLFLEVAKWS
jgi:hypothetical protein